MSIRTTIKKHYDLVRESGSFGFSVMIHICLFIVFFFITINPFSAGEPTKVSMPNVVKIGMKIRNTFREEYRQFFAEDDDGRKARIDNLVVVQYQGGDWDCEFIGSPAYGSIPNLIHEIESRTQIEIVNKTPVVVRADSPEIMKSPFVYFTGHQNFTLAEAEVENLRTYLLRGYAIVANSSLPGRRSRFDVAFRREMKRVVPDHDLTPVGKDHGIFNSAASFARVPVGMNYYAEPIEVVTINDHVGIIYNLNDYGDLMLARLNDDGKAIKYGNRIDYVKDDKGKGKPVVTGVRWEGPRVYSQHHSGRNLYAGCDNPETVRNAFLFNINILTYLLAR